MEEPRGPARRFPTLSAAMNAFAAPCRLRQVETTSPTQSDGTIFGTVKPVRQGLGFEKVDAVTMQRVEHDSGERSAIDFYAVEGSTDQYGFHENYNNAVDHSFTDDEITLLDYSAESGLAQRSSDVDAAIPCDLGCSSVESDETPFLLGGCLQPIGGESDETPFLLGGCQQPIVPSAPRGGQSLEEPAHSATWASTRRVRNLAEALEETLGQCKPTTTCACCVPYVTQQTRRLLKVVEDRQNNEACAHEMWRTLECLLSELLVLTADYAAESSSAAAQRGMGDAWEDCEDIIQEDMAEWMRAAQSDFKDAAAPLDRRSLAPLSGKDQDKSWSHRQDYREQDGEGRYSVCSTTLPSSSSSLPMPSSWLPSSSSSLPSSSSSLQSLPVIRRDAPWGAHRLSAAAGASKQLSHSTLAVGSFPP